MIPEFVCFPRWSTWDWKILFVNLLEQGVLSPTLLSAISAKTFVTWVIISGVLMGSQPRERRRKSEGEADRETSLITVISFDRSLAGFAVYGAPAGSPEVKWAGRCPGWELARRRESEGERAVMPEPITRCRDKSHTSEGGCELISTFERRREEEKNGWGWDGGGGGTNGAKECFLRRTCEAPIFLQGHGESRVWAKRASTP